MTSASANDPGMRESLDGTITLADIAYLPFHAMLRFLYSGEAFLEPLLALEATRDPKP